MLGLTSLEVSNSILNITGENNEFELYRFRDSMIGGVSYEKVRNEIGRDLSFSDITATDSQNDIIGPNIIEEYGEQVSERMKRDEYMLILAIYNSSIFQDFESFLRTEIDLVDDDIRLVLDDYNSSFITYETKPCFYTFKDLSEAIFNILQTEYELFNNSIDIEFDNITMKTKLVVRSGIIAIRFDKKSFLVL